MDSFLSLFRRKPPNSGSKLNDLALSGACVRHVAALAPAFRRPFLPALARLTGLANCVGILSLCLWSGCGKATVPPAAEAADEYLQALIEPEWGNAQQASPNWKQAYELLHPEAKANRTLADFNRQQWQWMKAEKRGWILEAEIRETEVAQEDATVNALLQFGQKQGEFDSLVMETHEVVVTLRKNGTDWAVVSVKDK